MFNGAIHLWNNYLPVFRRANFYELVLPESVPCMHECFEAMNNCFIKATFGGDNIDYDLATKMNTFSNFAMIFARILEFRGTNDEALRICDILLQKQLPHHLRKAFDTIRARISKGISKAGGAPAAPGKGGKDAPVPAGPSQAEIVTSEVISVIELISAQKGDKNASVDLIKKGMETLNTWTPEENEEIELELHAELWCRLGRHACDLRTNA